MTPADLAARLSKVEERLDAVDALLFGKRSPKRSDRPATPAKAPHATPAASDGQPGPEGRGTARTPADATETPERGKPAPGRAEALDRLREANHFRARATLARRGGKTGRADALQREATKLEDAVRADGWTIVAFGSDVMRRKPTPTAAAR